MPSYVCEIGCIWDNTDSPFWAGDEFNYIQRRQAVPYTYGMAACTTLCQVCHNALIAEWDKSELIIEIRKLECEEKVALAAISSGQTGLDSKRVLGLNEEMRRLSQQWRAYVLEWIEARKKSMAPVIEALKEEYAKKRREKAEERQKARAAKSGNVEG